MSNNTVIQSYQEVSIRWQSGITRKTYHPIEYTSDKLLHRIGSIDYIEFENGHLEPILRATPEQTQQLLDEIQKGGA
jgi:hypothetical protein